MRRRNGKHFLIFVQFSGFQKPWRVGADGGEGPPVPIPNTAVKLISADNTWLEAAREDRQAPTQEKGRAYHGSDMLFFIMYGWLGGELCCRRLFSNVSPTGRVCVERHRHTLCAVCTGQHGTVAVSGEMYDEGMGDLMPHGEYRLLYPPPDGRPWHHSWARVPYPKAAQ